MGSLDSFKRSSLEFLSSLIQADQSMFFETSQDTSRTVIFKSCVSRGEEPKFMDEFLSGTFNDDPYFRRWGFFPKTTTFRDTDMMPKYYRLKPRYSAKYIRNRESITVCVPISCKIAKP